MNGPLVTILNDLNSQVNCKEVVPTHRKFFFCHQNFHNTKSWKYFGSIHLRRVNIANIANKRIPI